MSGLRLRPPRWILSKMQRMSGGATPGLSFKRYVAIIGKPVLLMLCMVTNLMGCFVLARDWGGPSAGSGLP
jgi:hypothetical protein